MYGKLHSNCLKLWFFRSSQTAVPIRRALRWLAAAFCLLAAGTAARAGDGDPAPVLSRSGAWVEAYQARFSNYVAVEDHLQKLTQDSRLKQMRKTRADVLLVRLEAEDVWVAFRDVLEVDGKPVRDREERLRRLFLESPADLQRVIEESARYNIGGVRRNFNVPTLALSILAPKMQGRFKFRLDGHEKVDGIRAVKLDFTETGSPTLIRTGDKDHFATGAFWLHPDDGSVLQTRLVVGGEATGQIRATITVKYRLDEALGLLLPVEMREIYDDPKSLYPAFSPVLNCVATYSGYRKFEVASEAGTPAARVDRTGPTRNN